MAKQAIAVAVINMKGGVGKTTLATQLAWYHAMFRGDVLVVDLDPQANASQSLMSPHSYANHIRTDRLTVANIFEGFAPATSASPSPKVLTPKDVILETWTSPIGGRIHLIPSRLELSKVLRDSRAMIPSLPKFLAEIRDVYDLILIDCSPTDSILTDAAYLSSRYILVPIRLEYLATIGFPLLDQSIRNFKMSNTNKALEVCGLVFNDYQRTGDKRENRKSREDVTSQAKEYGWPMFSSGIPHSDSYLRSAREGLPIHRTPNVNDKVTHEFSTFATEFFKKIGLR